MHAIKMTIANLAIAAHCAVLAAIFKVDLNNTASASNNKKKTQLYYVFRFTVNRHRHCRRAVDVQAH